MATVHKSLFHKSLFRAEALRPAMRNFIMPDRLAALRPKLADWAKKLTGKKLDLLKETELLPDFITDIFGGVLGYAGPVSKFDTYSMKREALVKVDGKFADAAFGEFSLGKERFVAVLEGKGPKDPLDRPFAGRHKSAVEQAMNYAVQLKIDWYIVTNMRETRLYYKGEDTLTFETFETASFATDEAELRRFVYLLGSESVLNKEGRNHFKELLEESKAVGLKLTNKFYAEYRAIRESLFQQLCQHNPTEKPLELLAATQKILDRILFIAFAEDRELLPRESIAKAYDYEDEDERPVWVSFQRLFRRVNEGSAKKNIAEYNGGLFKADAVVDRLIVPDEVCAAFKDLAAYEYGKADDPAKGLIDVDILGHVFEQSISDLEEMQTALAGTEPIEQKRSSRKEAGAFYTPAFITQHIVRETLGTVIRERFERYQQRLIKATAKYRHLFLDPTVFVAKQLKPIEKIALGKFWAEWTWELEKIKVLDPSCGSGAFLIEAFNQLYAEYARAQEFMNDISGKTIFDIRKSILENNLYGVDLNEAAVGIARLSCWIQTAEYGKKLTSLDHNFLHGNSLVTDKQVHPDAFNWHAAFPEVFAAGGFDVVIGNPPYVRQEWIKEYKAHFATRFPEVFAATADLYVYFYALGFQLLKRGGQLGFVSSNSFVRARYAQPLRKFLAETCHLRQFIDLGDTIAFSEAKDVYPAM